MSKRVRAAYQGEPGAFSEVAARQLLGDPQTLPFASFEEIFEAVRTGDAECCVVPIENSLAGSIHRNYDLLDESGLTIAAEASLRIAHNLLAMPGATLADLRRVHSHPVALAQCGRFLRTHPHLEPVPVHDTAGAVRLVMERGHAEEAAIASERAGEIYGAATLAVGVEDHPRNFTRFFAVAPHTATLPLVQRAAASRWKTSLLLHIPNRPGALHRALGFFASRGIDLAKIESRPIEGRPWEYGFYLDLIGRAGEQPLAEALAELGREAERVKMLGTYRAAE
jgi:prephenate dehydratase